MNDLQVAWSAGLFEGEGSIVISRATPTGHPRVSLSLCSTDLDVVERFRLIVGTAGAIHVKGGKRAEHHKQQYQWGTGTNAEVDRVLRLLLPHLGERRTAKANEALAVLAWSRTHCARGHDKPSDQRGCGRCAHAWTPEMTAKRNATRALRAS